jgi:hypothetical protein
MSDYSLPILKERLLNKIVAGGNCCWIWTGGLYPNGYGQMKCAKGKVTSAHRVSYLLFKGSIPEDLQIDHLCRNRRCVNPKHLEVVDCRTNLLRGNTIIAANVAKTHCPHGHQYAEKRNSSGWRWCMECNRIQMRKRCLKQHRTPL